MERRRDGGRGGLLGGRWCVGRGTLVNREERESESGDVFSLDSIVKEGGWYLIKV